MAGPTFTSNEPDQSFELIINNATPESKKVRPRSKTVRQTDYQLSPARQRPSIELRVPKPVSVRIQMHRYYEESAAEPTDDVDELPDGTPIVNVYQASISIESKHGAEAQCSRPPLYLKLTPMSDEEVQECERERLAKRAAKLQRWEEFGKTLIPFIVERQEDAKTLVAARASEDKVNAKSFGTADVSGISDLTSSSGDRSRTADTGEEEEEANSEANVLDGLPPRPSANIFARETLDADGRSRSASPALSTRSGYSTRSRFSVASTVSSITKSKVKATLKSLASKGKKRARDDDDDEEIKEPAEEAGVQEKSTWRRIAGGRLTRRKVNSN